MFYSLTVAGKKTRRGEKCPWPFNQNFRKYILKLKTNKSVGKVILGKLFSFKCALNVI